MGRQTSKNRWVHGKKTLGWTWNRSEFAGGYECGTRIEIGTFKLVTKGRENEPEFFPSFDALNRESIIENFMKNGTVMGEREEHENWLKEYNSQPGPLMCRDYCESCGECQM